MISSRSSRGVCATSIHGIQLPTSGQVGCPWSSQFVFPVAGVGFSSAGGKGGTYVGGGQRVCFVLLGCVSQRGWAALGSSGLRVGRQLGLQTFRLGGCVGRRCRRRYLSRGQRTGGASASYVLPAVEDGVGRRSRWRWYGSFPVAFRRLQR